MANDTLKQLGMAALVFATSQILVASVLLFMGEGYFQASNWSRWDSGHYIHIAESGYELFPCAGKFGYPEHATEQCGNAGWFPGYPMLLRALSYFFTDLVLIAGIVSKIFYLLSIFMLYKLSGIKELDLKNFIFGCIGATWFGFIYYNAIFPISAVVFFILSGFYFVLKRNIWLVGVACFLTSLFYSLGFLVCGVLALNALIRNGTLMRKITDAAILIALGSAGVAMAFYIIHLDTGAWDAFIKVQEKYGHGWHDPLSNIIHKIQNIRFGEIASFQYYQSIGVLVAFIILTWFILRRKLFRNEVDLLTWLFAAILLAFSWTVGGDLSIYRSEALLFPMVISFRHLDMKWSIISLFILLLIGLPMAYLFFGFVLK